MNVLVYSGEGASPECTLQTKQCLRSLLSPNYAISTITAKQLLEEPWPSVTALLVLPGGRDLPYCQALNGLGTQRIREYVRKGGNFLGFCAGAYFAAEYIEFEPGTPLEVSGPRELGLFRGVARGSVFAGFEYGTNAGAKAVNIRFKFNTTSNSYRQAGDAGSIDETMICYFNGGCLFEGNDPSSRVLGVYDDPVDCEHSDPKPAAVVLSQIGKGRALLCGHHIEYGLADSLDPQKMVLDDEIHRAVDASTDARRRMLHALLSELSLVVPPLEEVGTPRLTPLLLTSAEGLTPTTDQVLSGLDSLEGNLGNPGTVLQDAADTFEFTNPTKIIAEPRDKVVVVYKPGELPSIRETPFFNHHLYFDTLREAMTPLSTSRLSLGATLLYGEVVTSTSSMLDRNPRLLAVLPHGLVAVGTHQVSGRGRGGNVWVNPAGVMAVSAVLRVRQSDLRQSLVFVQYLASLAVVQAVQSLGPKYRSLLDIRLKWPNDVYIRPAPGADYVKIGGVIVSVTSVAGIYVLVVGSGTNVDNPQPTTSINSVATANGLAPVPVEVLLGRFLAQFGHMFEVFCARGFVPFEQQYYDAWLHSGAVVILERYQNAKAIIRGISPEGGLLIAEALDGAGNPTGIQYELQPDGNSFDMFRGLIRKKL